MEWAYLKPIEIWMTIWMTEGMRNKIVLRNLAVLCSIMCRYDSASPSSHSHEECRQ